MSESEEADNWKDSLLATITDILDKNDISHLQPYWIDSKMIEIPVDFRQIIPKEILASCLNITKEFDPEITIHTVSRYTSEIM